MKIKFTPDQFNDVISPGDPKGPTRGIGFTGPGVYDVPDSVGDYYLTTWPHMFAKTDSPPTASEVADQEEARAAHSPGLNKAFKAPGRNK